MKKKLLLVAGIIGTVFVCVLIAIAIGSDGPSSQPGSISTPTVKPLLTSPTELSGTPEPTSTKKPTPTTKPTSIPTAPPGWHEIVRWEGKGLKNTETFNIPSHEWRILWDTKPSGTYEGILQIYVYNDAGGMVTVAANVLGRDEESSIMRGAGKYYLTINATQPYVVIVEAKY